MCFKLLAGILVPGTRIYKYDPIKKSKKLYKTSIGDSQNKFIQHCYTINELDNAIEKFGEDCQKTKTTVQPTIFLVGELHQVKYFYVYFNNIKYEAPTFIKCLDICFKCFMVLNFEYPPETRLIWLFIQNYIYDINLKNDPKNAGVCTLISEIKKL